MQGADRILASKKNPWSNPTHHNSFLRFSSLIVFSNKNWHLRTLKLEEGKCKSSMKKSSLYHEVFFNSCILSSSISEVQGKPNQKQGRARLWKSGSQERCHTPSSAEPLGFWGAGHSVWDCTNWSAVLCNAPFIMGPIQKGSRNRSDCCVTHVINNLSLSTHLLDSCKRESVCVTFFLSVVDAAGVSQERSELYYF